MAPMLGFTEFVFIRVPSKCEETDFATITVVPPLLLVLGSNWLPESPRWLLAQHRRDEALETLRRLDDADPVHGLREDHVRQECRLIESQLELDSRNPVNLTTVLKNASYRKRFLMGFFVQ